jgi:hypothetical protein
MKSTRNLFLAVLVACAVIGLVNVLAVHAQSAAQTSLGFTPGALSTCPAPKVGTDFLCDVTGVGIEQSVNGAAYATLQGAVPRVPGAGPAGATGAAGARLVRKELLVLLALSVQWALLVRKARPPP